MRKRRLLRGTSIAEGRDLTSVAFLVNLEALFERTIVQAFREAGVVVESKVGLRYEKAVVGEAPRTNVFEMDAYIQFAGMRAIVDAKFKDHPSSGNLHQMVAYSFLSGTRFAFLIFPHGSGTAEMVFRSNQFETSSANSPVRIRVLELRTDCISMAEWRESGRKMVEGILSILRMDQGEVA